MQDRIYSLIVEEKETTWKSVIMDMVSSGQMDPWNVNISELTSKYIEHIRSLQEADLKISGKMLLAAALLLKMKSARLVGDDLSEFDRLLAQSEMNEQDFYEGLEEMRDARQIPPEELLRLIPRTPQARTRKVTIFDLVNALEKALETKHRRLIKLGSPEAELILPHKAIDIQLAMKQVYKHVREYFTMHHTRSMKWSRLVPSEANKTTRMYTFLPLLYLGTQRKLDVSQKNSFDDFDIGLPGMFEEEDPVVVEEKPKRAARSKSGKVRSKKPKAEKEQVVDTPGTSIEDAPAPAA
jgi:segregation and condensation protein A